MTKESVCALKKDKDDKIIEKLLIEKLDHIYVSCEAHMPSLPPNYLLRRRRRRPQVSAYSLIAEVGHKSEKVSPPNPTSRKKKPQER